MRLYYYWSLFFTLLIIELCWISEIHGHFIGKNVTMMKRSDFIHKLLKDYDNNIPPNFDNDKPTTVECNIHVSSFDSINEINMDYSITIFMRQSWVDERLKFNHLINDSMITIGAGILEKLWVPDLYFSNNKRGRFHAITVPNRVLRLHEDGRVMYSARLSLTLTCPMDLLKFPLDTQMCMLKLESFSFTTDRMLFKWKKELPVEISHSLQLPQFKLVSHETNECTQVYTLGNFTCLEIRFYLQRQIGFYMIQTYIPSVLIVLLSWVSFWINSEAVPARISLGIITILAMITQSSGIRAALPRVSYIKAIDVWMSTCLAFVFLALLEYAIINVYSRNEIKRPVTMRNKKSSSGERTPIEVDNNTQEDVFLFDPRGKERAALIDKFSRRLFPGVFIFFNLVYWLVYSLLSDNLPANL